MCSSPSLSPAAMAAAPPMAASAAVFSGAISGRRRIPSMVTFVAAASGGGKRRKGKEKKSKVEDHHNFVAKPDESSWFFPEAVLLKQETVKEDGQVEMEFADAEEEQLLEFLNLEMESQLNLENMRHYEVVYLIHEDHAAEVQSVVSKVREYVRGKKGRIWRLNDWGLRRLAYKIKKASKANYILMNFEIDAKHINEFKSMLDKDERIIRHLVMKRDKAITKDCPPPPEFHSLQAQEGLDEEDEDYYEDDGEEWDEEGETEMAAYDEEEGSPDIIFVGSSDNEDDRIKKTSRELSVESV